MRKPLDLDNLNVRTTNGKLFTGEQSRELARLVYQRFGCNLAAATAAWQRMLQNSCPESDFADLVGVEA